MKLKYITLLGFLGLIGFLPYFFGLPNYFMIVLPYQIYDNIFKNNCQPLNLLFSRDFLGKLNVIFVIIDKSGILFFRNNYDIINTRKFI